MRRIALINQKGGVGKTTVTANLGAALARAGKRVVVVDLDPQANLTLYLGVELTSGQPSTYRVLTGEVSFGAALRPTSTPNLRILPTDIDLTGAELEISDRGERELFLRRALEAWAAEHHGAEPADYVLYDCPPSLGLISLNALAAADEVFMVVQTQFLALQGTSKLVEVIELVKRELHPGLRLSGVVPCLYDSRMRLAREVLAELRRYFPGQVFRTPVSANVKLAESPSFAKTIFEYAPDSIGARDFASLAHEVLTQETLLRAGIVDAPAKPPTKEKKRALAPRARPTAGAPVAKEAVETSVIKESIVKEEELPPAAPPPRLRPRKAPRDPGEARPPRPAPVAATGPRPVALERPDVILPPDPLPERASADAPATAPRRVRSKPASSS